LFAPVASGYDKQHVQFGSEMIKFGGPSVRFAGIVDGFIRT
jgi:hypothetical protein